MMKVIIAWKEKVNIRRQYTIPPHLSIRFIEKVIKNITNTELFDIKIIVDQF